MAEQIKYVVLSNQTTLNSNYSTWFDVADFVAKKFARELCGRGIWFNSKDSRLIAIMEAFRDNNKLNNKIFEIAYEMARFGKCIVSIDSFSLSTDDLRMTICENANTMITTAYEDPISVRLTKRVIKSPTHNFESAFLQEFWTKDGKIKRIFYYNKKIVSPNFWFAKIPTEYQFLKKDRVWNVKKDGNDNWYHEAENTLGFIPLQIFENNTKHKGLVDNWSDWNEAVNKCLIEIRRELSTTRSFLSVSGITSNGTRDQLLADGNIEIDIFTQSMASGQGATIQVVNPTNRLITLQQTYQGLMEDLLNICGMSYNKSVQGTAGTSETTSQSDAFNMYNQKRQFFNLNLKLYFQKLFKICGINKADFEIYLISNNDLSEQNAIDNTLKQQMAGTISRQEAIAKEKLVDGKTAFKIAKENKPQPNIELRQNGKVNESKD